MIYVLAALIGLLPVLPVLLKGSPILNNDMLVAYFCYFWDFHRNWSWSHPLVFWSSSYQCGMPMHAYWQSGFLYPITWLCFGPLSPHYGIYVFYAFHFFLGILGLLALGPRLCLGRPASLWAGICFSLSGTMLARYEHATFLAGWAWLPLVLAAFLALRDAPGPKTLFAYALAVSMQALGGHPQASIASAILIGAFTISALIPQRLWRNRPGSPPAPIPPPRARAGWILGGHALALLYCAPMLVPFLDLVGRTDRYAGIVAEAAGSATEAARTAAETTGTAAEKLEGGVFDFEEFSTGGMRPLHLLSLAAPHALGSPSDASWWGGEVWGEVFVYLGALGLFFCGFASWRRCNRDMRLLLILGAVGLWLAFGAHLGASQILYHVPVLNNFRRPARYLILVVLALAVLSGHGLQRWTGRPRGGRYAVLAASALLALAGACAALRFLPGSMENLAAWVGGLRGTGTTEALIRKLTALSSGAALDCLFLSLSAAALWIFARVNPGVNPGKPRAGARIRRRLCLGALFAVLLADLLRVHWDHFYLFPADFYRRPPATAQVLDPASAPFWRVSHYLEYPEQQLWNMHNDPLAHFPLLDREKEALGYGIHAVFGYRHVSAHLPLMWHWTPGTGDADKAARYLLTNREFLAYKGDSLDFLGRFDSVNVFEFRDWRPRIETASHARWQKLQRSLPSLPPHSFAVSDAPPCPPDFSAYGGICALEKRDGEFDIRGGFAAGDTLTVRERFHPEWKYRVDGGPWRRPRETEDHFMSLVFAGKAGRVDLIYSPREFYLAACLCLAVSLVLLGGFRYRAGRLGGRSVKPPDVSSH